MSTYEISKSSLLSLKAEILRKQDELVKAKAENEVKIKTIKKNTPLEIKNKGLEERRKYDITDEEKDLLKLSRSKLEAKAELYEKLSNNSKHLSEEEMERNRRYLVRFDRKNKSRVRDSFSDEEQDVDKYPESEEEKHFSDEYDTSVDPSEEWVEYTDCLGRTRTCLRKDLEYLKSKDADLKETVEAKEQTKDSNSASLVTEDVDDIEMRIDDQKEKNNEANTESELISGDMRRESLRKQWEIEEEELLNKTNIHYQNVLFNEARTHGVGYYAFSKDDEERAKQQEALNKLRDETEQQQKKARELKALREKQLAARMKAARNRRRARMGLPPEEDEIEQPVQEETKQTKEEQRLQQEQKQKEEAERVLEEARKRHLRPWDIGKEGVKEHYEYTQAEWVDKKRRDRPEEFAPPSSYQRDFRSTNKIEDLSTEKKSLHFTTKKIIEKRSNERILGLNPYKNSFRSIQQEDENTDDQLLADYKNVMSNLEAEVKRTKQKYMYQEIPQSSKMEPTPIINECEGDNNNPTSMNHSVVKSHKTNYEISSDSDDNLSRERGVEIAPPPTFDYYGPSESKKSRTAPKKNNIEDSIEAGLRYLRKQSEQRENSIEPP